MSRDLQGRPYATVSEVVEGTILFCDDGFTCIEKNTVKVVKQNAECMFIDCSWGQHGINSHIDETGQFYIGMYVATPKEILSSDLKGDILNTPFNKIHGFVEGRLPD